MRAWPIISARTRMVKRKSCFHLSHSNPSSEPPPAVVLDARTGRAGLALSALSSHTVPGNASNGAGAYTVSEVCRDIIYCFTLSRVLLLHVRPPACREAAANSLRSLCSSGDCVMGLRQHPALPVGRVPVRDKGHRLLRLARSLEVTNLFSLRLDCCRHASTGAFPYNP